MLNRAKIAEKWLAILELIAEEEEKGTPMVGERRELLKIVDNSIKYPGKFEETIINYVKRETIK